MTALFPHPNCQEFGLSAWEMDSVCTYCDVDHDGIIGIFGRGAYHIRITLLQVEVVEQLELLCDGVVIEDAVAGFMETDVTYVVGYIEEIEFERIGQILKAK